MEIARPASVISPAASASGAISSSGLSARIQITADAAAIAAPARVPISGSPSRRSGPAPKDRTISAAPKHSNGSACQGGMAMARTAPSSPATHSAMPSIQAVPAPMTHSAGPASPSGASSAPMTPAGITSVPITGTASRLASSPYSAIRLKCAAAIGAVTMPATSEDRISMAGGRSRRGRAGDSRDHGPSVRISATVAAKLS